LYVYLVKHPPKFGGKLTGIKTDLTPIR